MVRGLIALGCVASATAFVAPQTLPSVKVQSSVSMQAAKSKALPMVDCPKNLDGTMIGDVGFDPLLFSDTIDLTNAQAAELKHGRIAMLAVTGFLACQYVHVPGEYFECGPLEVFSHVPLAGHLQILLAIGIAELAGLSKTYSSDSTDPWDLLQQDPRAAKMLANMSPEKRNSMKLKELKNGRLAMWAIMGEVVHTMMFGHY